MGIGFGIWDIVGGARDIIFDAKEAEAYKVVAKDVDKQTDEYIALPYIHAQYTRSQHNYK